MEQEKGSANKHLSDEIINIYIFSHQQCVLRVLWAIPHHVAWCLEIAWHIPCDGVLGQHCPLGSGHCFLLRGDGNHYHDSHQFRGTHVLVGDLPKRCLAGQPGYGMCKILWVYFVCFIIIIIITVTVIVIVIIIVIVIVIVTVIIMGIEMKASLY